ncbi:rod shape-determining protein MreC [Novosphingobium sp. PC22D]|uniref:rod shape-determining protein MreC n=1 Tax=Novosphingobium sp. PC22D TaxID=1962403 RepID=UPI000BF01E17|nr:rod shape-determining protein MreC [Novosphingobium sp. PC22D]PEQ11178.1 rod shape-determining protein MreC [Novosphingobium sp. PC22D]
MAPPLNRRSGHSRRAQYNSFFTYAAGVAGVLLGAALLVVSIFGPSVFSGARALAADAVAPVSGGAARTRHAGQDIFETIAGYFKAGASHAKLEREVKEARVRLAEAEAVREENRRLKGLLGLEQRDPPPVAVTRMTSSTAASIRRFATIGAGRTSGIEKGMPVRSTMGLVGRVLEVGITSSRVLLVTDTESLVPVRRATDGVPAFAQGKGDGTIQIRLINLGINPLKKGDIMVTSGSGGLYRPGVAMAIVTSLTRDGAIARVLGNPSHAEYVIVEKTWAPEPPVVPSNREEPTSPGAASTGQPEPET